MTKIEEIIYDSESFISADGNFCGVEANETKENLKRISIEFAEWIRINNYHHAHSKCWANSYGFFGEVPELKTTEELFEMFNNSK